MPLSSLITGSFHFLMPVLFVVLALSGLLVYGSLVGTDAKRSYPVLRENLRRMRIGVLLLALLMCLNLPSSEHRLLGGQVQVRVGVPWAVLTGLTALVLIGTQNALGFRRIHAFETRLLVLLSWVGMRIILRATSFLTLYLGLELQALSFYVLAGLRRTSSFRTEAALKYFLLGAFTSGVLLFGMALLYRETGSLAYEDLNRLIVPGMLGDEQVRLALGALFVIMAMLFKLGRPPFHQWLPDVYEGRPSVVGAFFATVPKLGIIIALRRLCLGPFRGLVAWWSPLLTVVALLSLTVAALGALRQRKIKRFLAYRSIGHAGYLLLALSTGGLEGASAVVFYTFIYALMTALVWLAFLRRPVIKVNAQGSQGSQETQLAHYIRDLKGLSKLQPALAFSLRIGLLSMAGIPPLAGFLAKGLVFFRAVRAGLPLAAFYALLTAVVRAFYYLRWIKTMYFDAVETRSTRDWPLRAPMTQAQRLILARLRIALLLIMLYPDPVLIWRQRVGLALIP